MGGLKRCLICLNYLKSKKKTVRQHSLEEQSVVTYFLRKLAWSPIPTDNFEKFLRQYGHPSEWAALCYICEQEVKKCLDMHREVMKILKNIANIRKKLYEENYYETDEEEGDSDNNDGGDEKQPASIKAAFKELRKQLFSQMEADSNVQVWNVDRSVKISYEDVTGYSSPLPTLNISNYLIFVKQEPENLEDSYSGNDNQEMNQEFNMFCDDTNTTAVQDDDEDDNDYGDGNGRIQYPFDKFQVECPICAKTYERPNGLRRHYKESHVKVKKFKCQVCFKKFLRSEYLRNHMQAKHPEKVTHMKEFKCSKCPSTFKIKGALCLHYKKKHREKKDVSEIQEKESKRPMQHDKSERTCFECNKTFVSKAIFRRHIREVHEKIKFGVCPVCGKSFPRKSDLDRHVHIVHRMKEEKEGKKFICTSCEKEFKCESMFEKHMRNDHGTKIELICEICGKSYSNSASLAVHKKSKHDPLSVDEENMPGSSYSADSSHLSPASGEATFMENKVGEGEVQETNSIALSTDDSNDMEMHQVYRSLTPERPTFHQL